MVERIKMDADTRLSPMMHMKICMRFTPPRDLSQLAIAENLPDFLSA